MRFLSVCSGIEAASVAWQPLGWKAAAFSEIEPFPCAVLAHRYPDVPNLGDMTKFKDWPDDLSIDLLCGGTPCQSFSVAGLRKGLSDPRGNLMLTYLAIAAKYRPQWVVWENVPGVLSSWSGADETGALHEGQDEWEGDETSDFSCFLAGLEELGYGWAFRSFDAQFAGLAQRRERVFVVGCLGDWHGAAAVLLERHSLSGHPAPRREAGKGVTGTLSARTEGGGGLGTDFELGGGLIPDVGRALTTSNQRIDAETETFIVTHALTGEGFDASEDGTGRGTPLVPVLPFDPTQITSVTNRSNPQAGDPCHTLAKGAHAPAIAFDCKASGQNGFGVGEIASTMRAMGHANSHTNGGGHQAVAFMTRGSNLDVGDISATMGVNAGSASGCAPMAQSGMQVRRLTPRECERLQGFPDDYTAVPHRGKPAADGPRYKALGNSWAVPCARWIGQRIEAVEAITQKQLEAA